MFNFTNQNYLSSTCVLAWEFVVIRLLLSLLREDIIAPRWAPFCSRSSFLGVIFATVYVVRRLALSWSVLGSSLRISFSRVMTGLAPQGINKRPTITEFINTSNLHAALLAANTVANCHMNTCSLVTLLRHTATCLAARSISY
jgi:hypothetical protein